jgi:pilus assembly protein CpaB
MNKRFIGVLMFAFVVALGASLVLYRVLSNKQPSAKAAQTSTVHIAVATRDLELGRVLKEDDVKLEEWSGAVPVGATNKVQDLVGRGVINTIVAKEPILETRLAAKGAGGGLAAMIPPGMRAVAIRVNEVVGVAGFVVPGMRVDVLISGNSPGGNGNIGTVTKTLLQNLEVLSAGQDFKKDSEGKPILVQVVNMLVTPEQAEILSLASNQTTLQLVLRNPLDRQMSKTSGTSLKYLFSGQNMKPSDFGTASELGGTPAPRPRPQVAVTRPPAIRELLPAPKKEKPFVMEIISGTRKVDQKFENAGEGK